MTILSAEPAPRPYRLRWMLWGILLLSAGLGSCATSSPTRPPVSTAAEPTSPPQATTEDRVVRIDSGLVEGTVAGGVLSFKGIPYAAPPVGDRRWRPPAPPAPWTGIHRAAAFGHDCMQVMEASAFVPAVSLPSEDCLVLNIWRPARWTADKPLPIMVWLHGGAYVTGGTSTSLYDGATFARHDMIFVSLNYRLGRFGFFAHPALISADDRPVGNYAFMDQLAALEWIQRNIAAFGGDPHHVTLVGESAGGDAVLHLLTSPRAKGLFHRAVVMSGGGRTPLLGDIPLTGGTARRPSADQIGLNFARTVGITGLGLDALRDLRNLPAEQVKGSLSLLQLVDASPKHPTYVKGAIIDGTIVTDVPGALLARGQAPVIPLMIGTTCRELSVAAPSSRENPLSHFGSKAKNARAAYARDRILDTNDLYAAIGSDMTMQEPARFVAAQNARSGGRTWLYRFCYVAQSLRGKNIQAAHGSELPFAFDRLVDRYGEEATDLDRATAKTFNTYMANFVKSGDPNGPSVPAWSAFDSGESALMLFTQHHGPAMMSDPWTERLDLIRGVAEDNRHNPQVHR